MPKFSIVVPVYNVEPYIKKCLDSIFNQSFKDYEVIVVNDGTKDKSMDIVKKYDVKIINQENKGLSEARNAGVKKATGDYIIFIDSDDYIENNLLKEINNSASNNPDLIRFQAREIVNNSSKEYNEQSFTGLNGTDAFEKITKYHYVELACLYAIKRKYFIDNSYSFKKGLYHEDFGLMPLVIFNSQIVNSINYIGYNYVQRNDSIMNNKSYEKTIKKIEDTIVHYDYLYKNANETKKNTTYFNSFISNSLILKIIEAKSKDYKKYKKILKEKGVFDNLLGDTLARKIKRGVLKISPKFYYKLKGR